MELDARKRLWILVGIIAGLLIVFFLVVRLLAPKSMPAKPALETPGQAAGDASALPSVDTGTAALPSQPALPPAQLYPQQLARVFVERFGSYSSQNENKHIEDVLPLTTARMAAWLGTQKVVQTSAYTGKTTRVIVLRTRQATDAKATVEVQVQEELSNEKGSTTAYRTGRVELIKNGETWQVDGLFWE